MTERTHELHGIEGQPFPDFSESSTYLERVTIPTEAEAIEVLQSYGADWGDEPELQAIWMRNVTGDEAQTMIDDDEAYTDFPDFWWECDEDHPNAVPFWKDGEW